MKTHVGTIILAALIILGTTARSSEGQTGPEVPEMASLDSQIESFMNKWSVPGGAVAVSYQGRLVYARGFGYADVENQIPVQPTSTFRIASVSKSVTGIAVAKLIDDGLLSKDAIVFGSSGILTGARYDTLADPRMTDITVGDLLHHVAGLGNLGSGRDPVFADLEVEAAAGFGLPHSPEDKIEYYIKSRFLNSNPGDVYVYSNLGYLILGRVVEAVTGMSYADYCETALFEPLGISTFKMGHSLLENRHPHEVKYYEYPGAPTTTSVYGTGEQVPWSYGGMNVETFDAHGGWTASPIDLVKLLNGADGLATAPDIISAAAVQTMTAALPNSSGYAMGFSVNQFGNWWHVGSIPGGTAEWVRGNGGFNYALLFNYRPQGNQNGAFIGDMDGIFWNARSSFSGWPSHDLFSMFTSIDGVATDDSRLSISVYPNPTVDNVRVALAQTAGRTASIAVFDLLGRVVAEPTEVRDDAVTIDLSHVPAGIYFVRATDGDAVTTQKLTVTHK